MVFQVSGSIVTDEVAVSRGVFSLGFASDYRTFLGSLIYTSAVYEWGQIYVPMVESFLNGTFNATFGGMNNWFGFEIGVVEIAPTSLLVPPEWEDAMQQARTAIIEAGTNETIFCGGAIANVVDAQGNPVYPEGYNGCLSALQVITMDYTFPGVEEVSGDFYFTDVYLEEDDSAAIAMFVAIGIAFGLSILFLIATVFYHNTAIIRFASPLFVYPIFVGAFIEYVAAILYLLVSPLCNLQKTVWQMYMCCLVFLFVLMLFAEYAYVNNVGAHGFHLYGCCVVLGSWLCANAGLHRRKELQNVQNLQGFEEA